MTQFKTAVQLLTILVLLSGAAARADIQAVHGMLLFSGEKTTYASHLPMFHSPHERQLILKISLGGVPGSSALKAFEAAQKAGKKFFTIEPEVMDLSTASA